MHLGKKTPAEKTTGIKPLTISYPPHPVSTSLCLPIHIAPLCYLLHGFVMIYCSTCFDLSFILLLPLSVIYSHISPIVTLHNLS